MKDVLRVLYINGGIMDRGGISVYMMNYYRYFDREKIQIDFVVHGKQGDWDEEIHKMGGHIYYLPTKKENLLKWANKMRDVLNSGQYSIVHSHMDGMNGFLLKMAKECEVPIRISHSHNTEHLTNNPLKKIFHEYSKHQIKKYATHMWACSKNAAEWLYGQESNYEVVPNAIETKKYLFDAKKREELRRKMGLEHKYVIGHIGRLEYQKNQEFLLTIFGDLVKENKDAILILVGIGKNKENLQADIAVKGLQNNVILFGKCDNIGEILNVFDVFAFPSRFEGLGIVVVEAQCNGLHCICSENVPEEVNITGNVEFIKLEQKKAWIEVLKKKWERKEINGDDISRVGYAIESAALKLQDKYLQMESMR